MGGLFSSLWASWFPAATHKLLVVGLDAAGKTTLLYRLSLNETVATLPTVGANVEEVEHKGAKFEVWDLGGQQTLRPVWSAYFPRTAAVVFVIDSTDRARLPLARAELHAIMAADELARAAVLVLANKQDLRDAASVAEVSDALALHTFKRSVWTIQPACALTGDGLQAGLEWVAAQTHSGGAGGM